MKKEIKVTNQLKDKIEGAFADLERRRKEAKESDPIMQRNKTLTHEEKGRRGVEHLTRVIVEHARSQGRHVSEDAARSQAAEIARKADRRDSER